MDHPHASRSLSDWDIEHQECIQHALQTGIDNLPDLLSFAIDNMTEVSPAHLEKLWAKRCADEAV